MFDVFLKNLHYFKIINNSLIFNNAIYYLNEVDTEKTEKKFIIDLLNEEDIKEQLLVLIYDIYKDLPIIWVKSNGFDGKLKYIDRAAYVEYFDERLEDFRRVTIKNFRFYSEEEDVKFLNNIVTNLYELIYA